MNAGYSYTKSRDRMSLTSSQALSNFQFAPLDGTMAEVRMRGRAVIREALKIKP